MRGSRMRPSRETIAAAHRLLPLPDRQRPSDEFRGLRGQPAPDRALPHHVVVLRHPERQRQGACSSTTARPPGVHFGNFERATAVTDRIRFVEHSIDELKRRYGMKSDRRGHAQPHARRPHERLPAPDAAATAPRSGATRTWWTSSRTRAATTWAASWESRSRWRGRSGTARRSAGRSSSSRSRTRPGHTEYQMALFATIDGNRVAFTGDAFFAGARPRRHAAAQPDLPQPRGERQPPEVDPQPDRARADADRAGPRQALPGGPRHHAGHRAEVARAAAALLRRAAGGRRRTSAWTRAG